MNSERKQILEMLAEGKITADEAERLMDALDRGVSAPQVETADGKRPKFLHVKVQSSDPSRHGGRENVDIKIPIILLKAGMKLGSLMPEHAKSKFSSHLSEKGLNIDLNDLDSKNIEVLLQALTESSIDIDADNEKVRIFCG